MSTDRLRVLVLFGTRPELIKLFPVLERLGEDDRFHLDIVSTSQHREMLDGLLGLFSIRPDYDLDIMRPDQSLGDISVRTLRGLEPIFRRQRPDLILIQGDTTSAFIGALAGFYHRVPVGHIEAGLRSFDKRHPYPEEVNRRLISVLGDLHFAPLESNEQNLLREGVEASKIYVTGNTVIDALIEIRGRKSRTLDAQVPEEALAGRRMVLVTAHRRESFDEHLAQLCRALRELVSRYPDLLLVYPVHLNPKVRQAVRDGVGEHEQILLLDPLPYEDFLEAMDRSHLIITDSGGVQEEAPHLGKPVLVFRQVTERGEGVAANGATIVGLDPERLLAEAARLLDSEEAYREMGRSRMLYGDGQASRRIVEAILHYFQRGDPPDRFEAAAAG